MPKLGNIAKFYLNPAHRLSDNQEVVADLTQEAIAISKGKDNDSIA